jgi:hypothetical protein
MGPAGGYRAAMNATPRDDVFLRVYLNDHRAGAAGGLARARDSARRNRGSRFGDVLETLATQLESDVQSLDSVLDELSVPANPWKRTLILAGERIGRLKPNGRLLQQSPVSLVLEIELLMAGIDAKRSLWRALQVACGAHIQSVDLDDLLRRADEQQALLRELHPDAARIAFAGEGVTPR